jgi:hypothetical protein
MRVFENTVLRKIFGPEKEKMVGGWRRLHSDELRNLYASPNIIRVIKLRRIRWTGHVARKGEIKMHTVFWLVSLKERDNSEDL